MIFLYSAFAAAVFSRQVTLRDAQMRITLEMRQGVGHGQRSFTTGTNRPEISCLPRFRGRGKKVFERLPPLRRSVEEWIDEKPPEGQHDAEKRG